jgi:hypothetical protein
MFASAWFGCSKGFCQLTKLRFKAFDRQVHFYPAIDLFLFLRPGAEDGELALKAGMVGKGLTPGLLPFRRAELGGLAGNPRGLEGFDARDPALV